MKDRVFINSKEVPAAIGAYSQAVKCGDIVWLSGQIPLDPTSMTVVGDNVSEQGVRAQVNQVFTNLKNLLLTRKGERFEQPNFGTDLLNALFEPNTSELKTFIEETITTAVAFWLPYIEIVDLDIATQEDDPLLIHKIQIKITFSVTGTGSEQVITIFAGEDGIVTIE